MRGRIALGILAAALWLAPGALAAEAPCELEPRYRCYGIESLSASLSISISKKEEEEGKKPPSPYQAGAHPDLSFSFAVSEDPKSKPNKFGLYDSYEVTRNVRIELPPGLVGNPNVLGDAQQCTVVELFAYDVGDACPNGSQIGITKIYAYDLDVAYLEPVYMMVPPGGDVVARLGFIAGIFPTFIDLRVRSEGDYGIDAEVVDSSAEARLIKAETTTWGVPADPVHNKERCTPAEVFPDGCVSSPSRPPGTRELPFLTNPTGCGAPLELRVGAASWVEPERFDFKSAPFPQITGCDKLPYVPSLVAQTTSRATSTPTGLNMTIALPENDVKALEPSQTRYMRIDLPAGLAVNPGAAEGLGTCSAAQVRFEENAASECPDAAKIAATEFDVPVLERKLRGAIYLREPEPGDPYRIWIVADDLGLHVKLPGTLEVDKQTGQIHSVVLGAEALGGIPQAPLREVRLELKSGLRAPLVTPPSCDADPSTPKRDPYLTHYEFTPWSGGPPADNYAPMTISEGCDARGFAPRIEAGATLSQAGAHSPFGFILTRGDNEENIAGLDITLPEGLAATFAGVARCEGIAAETGACPAASRVGRVVTAVGAGSNPLWVPQPGKRPADVYLSGPYKGAPLSIVSVVPKQAGPFDFGDEVVRSAVHVDPLSARATAVADPLPQIVEGIPISYRTIDVQLDRPGFSLNPTSCARKETTASLTSSQGSAATASSSFAATGCANLAFKPRLGMKLEGGTKRGRFPALKAVFHPRVGNANPASIVVRLPHSAFLEQGHIRTVCTRVQFAAGAGNGVECPPGSIYGQVTAYSPLLDEPLAGPVILRSSSHSLPDMVLALHGPPSLPIQIEAVGRIDSVKGGIRSSFEALPDAPLTAVVLKMQGGRKGLIVNSTDLCARKHRVVAALRGHNGKRRTLRPLLRPSCKGKARAKSRR